MKFIIDHEFYGDRSEFETLEEAQAGIRSCGPEFAATTLTATLDTIYDEHGEAVGIMRKWTHEFCESGNGFPTVGDEVIGGEDGRPELLKVVEISRIQTQQWEANSVYLVCQPADRDWDDLTEDEQDDEYQNGFHVATAD